MTATNTSAASDTRPLLLNVTNATLMVTPEQFDRLCIDNPDLRLELTADGQLMIQSPHAHRCHSEELSRF